MFSQSKRCVITKNVWIAMTTFIRRKEILILVFVLAATFLSLSPSLRGEFTNWDDRLLVVDNPEIRSLDFNHLKTIFTSTASLGYIPLTILSFAAEHHFFGLNPFVFHLDNLLLHLIVIALIFWLGLRLGLGAWAAGLAALLFGIHPMHVEAVAWVSARKDGLYAVFYLLAMHSHLTYIEKKQKRFFLLTVACGILSMLAKPMALSLPLILWVLDWMKGKKFTLQIVREKIPHFLYIIPLMLITYRIHPYKSIHSLSEALLIWIWSAAFYIEKFLFPFPVVPRYSLPQPVTPGNLSYLTALAFLAICVLIFIRFKRNRWLMFAVLFYFFSIFFLFRFDHSNIKVVADRYMYLPSLGFCFLFGFLIRQDLLRLEEKRRLRKCIAIAGLAVFFGALSVQSFFQCRVWKDSLTLWSEMIRYNPDNSLAFYNRAKAYEFEKEYDLARADYSKALTLNPTASVAYNNRGVIFLRQDRADDALQDFNTTIELDPAFAEAYSNRSLVYSRRQQYDSALADLNTALKFEPGLINAYGNRGLIYANMKQYDLAIENYDRALQIDSSIAVLYYYRAQTYADTNRFDAAIADARKAQSLGYQIPDGFMEALKQHNVHD